MIDFEELITPCGPGPAIWCHHCSKIESTAYLRAMDEALDLPDGEALLIDAKVSFRNDVAIDYLGEGCGLEGTSCHVLSFRLGDQLEVITWSEITGFLSYLAYRGDRALFERLALELRLFGGECFSHLRSGPTEQAPAHQHILTLPCLPSSQGKAP